MDFQSLVDEHYEGLYRFAFSLAKNSEDAADLTQQTYAIWARKQNQINDPSKVKSWLFTTLYREFLNQKRRQKKFVSDEPDLPERMPFDKKEPFLEQIDSTQLMSCLSQLDEMHRTPLSLFYLQDYSYKEISEILDLPMGTVMSRLNRAKSQLRETILQSLTQPDILSFPQLDK